MTTQEQINLLNKKFNRLTVIEKTIKRTKCREVIWKCLCDCGNITYLPGSTMKNGATKSCGCFKLDYLTNKMKNNQFNLKHGGRSSLNSQISRTYKSWQAMKERCINPKNNRFKYYGGRGIKVCDRWLNSFENFLKDMNKRPKGKTLDRINTNGNYEPGNCKWSTPKQQANNRRNNGLQ